MVVRPIFIMGYNCIDCIRYIQNLAHVHIHGLNVVCQYEYLAKQTKNHGKFAALIAYHFDSSGIDAIRLDSSLTFTIVIVECARLYRIQISQTFFHQRDMKSSILHRDT